MTARAGRQSPIPGAAGHAVGIPAALTYPYCMTVVTRLLGPAARLATRVAAAVLFVGLAGAHADTPDQGWIPPEITLPQDMEIVIDRRIGSANRMLSFTTQQDADRLADTWRAALEQGPYQVKPAAEGMSGRLIEFSGGRIRNGQISFLPGAESTATTVQFDASIND